jgi:hypothetical protein
MEDFLSLDALAGQAASLIAGFNAPQTGENTADEAHRWIDAAEACVLMRIDQLRLIGGLPRHEPPLTVEERLHRLQDLLRYWAEGCLYAVDERLFADILNRRADRA